MAGILRAPHRYIQGRGELENIARYTEKLGDRALCVISSGSFKRVEKRLMSSFPESETKVIYEHFNHECTRPEIRRIMKICRDNEVNVVIGIGGGKTLDTAKAVGFFMDIPVAVAPTAASSDAPCSSLSAIYEEDGTFSEYLHLKDNPALVLVDTEIIAQSPSRLLAAGMGDALSTYFEARAVKASGAETFAGGKSTMTALKLARLAYDTVLDKGSAAILSAEARLPGEILENIVEADTLLSGIAFESAGIAAAHSIANAFTHLPDCRNTFHGELVAFGTAVQLILEDAPQEELDEVTGFCRSVGLSLTLSGLGVSAPYEEKIKVVSHASVEPGESIHNMPFPVTAEDVYDAIFKADALGREKSDRS